MACLWLGGEIRRARRACVGGGSLVARTRYRRPRARLTNTADQFEVEESESDPARPQAPHFDLFVNCAAGYKRTQARYQTRVNNCSDCIQKKGG